MRKEYLPDSNFQSVHTAIRAHYLAYNEAPTYGVLLQKFTEDDDATE